MSPQAHQIKAWRTDPVKFAVDVFNFQPDPWQVDVLRAFPVNQRLAMKACKGPGKTAILSILAWNFLATRPFPKIAATSINADNLSDGLWAEMAKWQMRSELLKSQFQWTKTRIFNRTHPENWFMSARSWSKSADTSQQADALAGLHADYIMFMLDESGGIPDSVMAAAEAALSTGIECKLVQAGNPTMLEGPLYRACTTERDIWWVIEITGDPDDPKRAARISVQWARDQIKKYGIDNPWVLVNVFGRFPPSSINTLLGPDEVQAAMTRHLHRDKYEFAQKRLGVDVARFGDDATVLFPRQGLVAFKPTEMRGMRNPDIAARIMLARSRWQQEIDFVDGTGGFGGGVIDCLIQAGQSPVEVQFSGKAIDPRYYNKRAEMWFNMAEWIKRGGVIPNMPELKKQLTAPTYTIKGGKMLLESKEQIKERLGMSPDHADALALTFAYPEMPASMNLPGHNKNRPSNYKSDYDALSESNR